MAWYFTISAQPNRPANQTHILGAIVNENGNTGRDEDNVATQSINQGEHADEDGDQQPLLRPDNVQPVTQDRAFRRRVKTYSKLLFFPPAIFTQAHIILIYFGSRLTYPSSRIIFKGNFK